MFRAIYEPRTRAREYCDYAINIYTGCPHGCAYCYAEKMHHRYHPNEPFGENVRPKDGLMEALNKQLSSGKYAGKKIMLCFMCDPYPIGVDTSITREVIKAIKGAGAYVQILTKGSFLAERDFDLLDGGDSFGVTYTGGKPFQPHEYEPHAAPSIERLAVLERAKRAGIKTWVSCEPVFEPEAVYSLIRAADYIDLFRIGKMNYRPSDINWAAFGFVCEELCRENGRNYYIKEDLRKEMEAQ